MKNLKKIFNYFGYTITRKHKTEDLRSLIKLRLDNNPCDCLIDVGSNVGDFLNDYNQFFSDSYAFEPNNDLVPELKKRFINNIDIHIFNYGVGEFNTSTDLFITGDKGKTLSSIKNQKKIIQKILRNTEIIKKENIKIINFKDFKIKNKLENKSFFLKTDTQGNDLEVLLGLKDFIKKVKFIKIEMPVINIYDINYKFSDLNDFMKSNNFVPLHFQHITRNVNGELIEYDVIFEKINF